MLRSFRVANHKSIFDEQELLLMPAYDKTRPVVPVAAVFGANASGKSNLLDAFRWMRNAVCTSFGSWQPGTGVPRRPFKLTREGRQKPSEYSVEVIVNDVPYTYGFSVDDEVVREEWLHAYPQRRKRIIFEREGGTWTFGSMVPQAKYELARELTRSDSLFLTVAANASLNEVVPVHNWFQQITWVEPDETGEHPFEFTLDEIEEYVGRSEAHRRMLVELLKAADLGVTDIVTAPEYEGETRQFVEGILQYLARSGVTVDALVSEASRLLSEKVLFAHAGGALMVASEESFGTRAWLKLLLPVLGALENGSLTCVDEIDASLHPNLTAQLIALFKNRETNPHSAQLLFTTHDATLLDDEILERDEVWFVDKTSESGVTRLYSLSDFHPRKHEDRVGRYLVGSYGAIPIVSGSQFKRALRPVESHRAAA